MDFARQNTHSNTDSNTQTNVNSGPVTTATIPYIRGTSETIARILQHYNTSVAHKPITTLRRLLTKVKDKDKPEDRQGAVCEIKCCDCQASYIAAPDWPQTNVRREMVTSTITLLSTILQTKHKIGWPSATCFMYSTDYCQRLTLESWFTILEQTPLNRSQQLPAPYKRLVCTVPVTVDRWFCLIPSISDLLTESSKTAGNYERTTERLIIWLTKNECFTLTIDRSKRTNDITSLHSQ